MFRKRWVLTAHFVDGYSQRVGGPWWSRSFARAVYVRTVDEFVDRGLLGARVTLDRLP